MKFILVAFIFLAVACGSKDTVKQTIKIKSVQISETSEITCPNCGFKKTEKLPTDVCVIKYTCTKCLISIFPKEGDCCVYCSYGDHKCPSKQ